MSLIKIVSFLSVGGAMLLPLFCFSCNQFSGEFNSEQFVLVETIKYDDGCITTLYADGEYISSVKSKNCRFYMKTTTAKGK